MRRLDGGRFGRPGWAGGLAEIFGERGADAERDAFFAAEEELLGLEEKVEVLALQDGDLGPGNEERGMADAKEMEERHVESGAVGADGDDIAVVGEETHIGRAKAPLFSLEFVFETEFAGEGHPAADGGDEKRDEAPETNEEEDRIERKAQG